MMKNIIITIFSTFILISQCYGQVEYVVTGSGNAFSLNYPANVTVLTSGLSFTFKSNHSITGPATLAVNGLGAVSIKKEVSQNLIANDILNNQIVTVVYDGTNFQMTSKAGTSGGGGADSHIQDLGGNTFIETDAIGDGTGDVIDFNLGGTQHFQMDGSRIEVLNSGGNVLIGEGAGVATSTGTNNVSLGTSSGTANTTGFGNVNVGYETDLTRITTNGNTSVGYQAGRNGTSGNYTTMIGFQAGMNSSSERSTLIGYQAGLNNTGDYTVAVGYGAGSNNTFFDPVYIGRFAGYNNTSGQNNVAIGAYSLNANVTSGYNVAVGYGTLRNNTASWNTAVGNNALNSNVTGTENAAFGTDALIDNTSSNNSAFGSQALRSTTSGQRNTASGYYSLRGNTIGNYNTALGAYAGDLNTTGSSNTLIGYQADVAANNLTNATAIGANSSVAQSNALILGNAADVGIGTSSPSAKLDVVGTFRLDDGTQAAGYVLTSDATGNASWQAAGGGASSKIEDANANTSINVEASPDQDVIHFNLGGNSGYPTNEYFTMIGPRLEVINSGNSVFIGENAGANDDISVKSNVAIGTMALNANITGSNNIAIGASTLTLATGGGNNTAIGHLSGTATTTGISNTFYGYNSGNGNTTGGFNTVVGSAAGNINATGSNNVLIGYNAETSVDGLTNASAIGANASVATSNSLILGNNANVGIGTSSPADKLEIEGTTATMLLDHTAAANFSAVLFSENNSVDGYIGQQGSGNNWEMEMKNNSIDPGAGISFVTTIGGPTPITRMRIANDGNVGIGTTGPVYKLDVNGDIAISSDVDRFVRVDEGADLVPVAYGVLDTESSPGTIAPTTAATSTSNYTTEYLGAGEYKIVYVGPRNFSGLGEAHVTITPYGINPVFASYQITGSKEITVRLFDQGGSPVDTSISFTLRVK